MAENENLQWPTKDGWFWVLIDGYTKPAPCWYMHNNDPDDRCFLPGGMGDSSSMGLFEDDITKIGPEIEAPKM